MISNCSWSRVIESYYFYCRKQIDYLLETMDKLEKRLLNDLECTEADYESKLQRIKELRESDERMHQEEIENLKVSLSFTGFSARALNAR